MDTFLPPPFLPPSTDTLGPRKHPPQGHQMAPLLYHHNAKQRTRILIAWPYQPKTSSKHRQALRHLSSLPLLNSSSYHTFIYILSLLLLASSSILSTVASPTSPDHSEDHDNSNSNGSSSGVSVHSDVSYDGELLMSAGPKDRHRLAKMSESVTPHLQSLMRDLWHWRTHYSPEYATMVGLNDNTAGLLDSFTETHFQDVKDQCSGFLSRALELDEAALSFEDQLNLRILKHFLSTYIDHFDYIKLFAPVSALEGPHMSFPRLVGEQMALRSYDDFQKLLSRYGGFPHQVDEILALLEANVEAGAVPPALALDGLLERLSAFAVSVSESEFFKPFVDLPPTITEMQRRALRQQAQERVAQDVLPAYHALHQFVENSYIPHARSEVDLSIFAGGPEQYEATLRYHTATALTPAQIHALAITELRRIEPLLRQAVLEAGLAAPDSNASLPELLESVRKQPGRFFDSSDELQQAFEEALSTAGATSISQAFDTPAPTDLGVRLSPLPVSRRVVLEAGSLDGGRSPLLTLDASHLSLVSREEVTALAVSSGTLGHHFLSDFLLTSPGLPTFRRHLGDVRLMDAPSKLPVYSSFVEGWALYGQFLGDELGMYPDPGHRLGWRAQESLQAALMAVDTGLHHLRWTLDDAQKFLLEHTPLSSEAALHELRRVVTWPGLACSAKVGEIKLKELRQKAVNALGELFSLTVFHTVVMRCAGPINLLQLCVDHYIDSVTHEDAAARSRGIEEQAAQERQHEASSREVTKHETDYTPASGVRLHGHLLTTALLPALVIFL